MIGKLTLTQIAARQARNELKLARRKAKLDIKVAQAMAKIGRKDQAADRKDILAAANAANLQADAEAQIDASKASAGFTSKLPLIFGGLLAVAGAVLLMKKKGRK